MSSYATLPRNNRNQTPVIKPATTSEAKQPHLLLSVFNSETNNTNKLKSLKTSSPLAVSTTNNLKNTKSYKES